MRRSDSFGAIKPSTQSGEANVADYAISELRELLSQIQVPVHQGDPVVRYVCALFSELTYYHVNWLEIDNKKRTMVIPSDGYQILVSRGIQSNVKTYLRQADIGRPFIVVDRGVVAVGLVVNGLLFIAFRGTRFLFDWVINAKVWLVEVNTGLRAVEPFLFSAVNGRMHGGYSEEAFRISLKIIDELHKRNFGTIQHVFFTGHSLGGAVAAIARNIIRIAPSSSCLFGSPRYGDLASYSAPLEAPPEQIRRPGDVVPLIPPHCFGYVDHPCEFNTAGMPIVESETNRSTSRELLLWVRFLAKMFKPHFMEEYRRDVGQSMGAKLAQSPLVDFDKLTWDNVDEL